MNFLAHLSVKQRVSIGAVAALLAVGIWALVRHQREADFKPLFTGLPPEDAAAIVQKLRETGVEYRLPETGGAVLAPSSRLAELRIAMAAAGLPKMTSVVSRNVSPAWRASAAWSITANSFIPLAVIMPVSLATVPATDWRLSLVTTSVSAARSSIM